MRGALEQGSAEFVELLLDQGVNMANLLTLEVLEGLYSAVSSERFICFVMIGILLSLVHLWSTLGKDLKELALQKWCPLIQ